MTNLLPPLLPSPPLASPSLIGLLAPGAPSLAGAGLPAAGALAKTSFANLLHPPHPPNGTGIGPGALALDVTDDPESPLDPAVRHSAHLAPPGHAQDHAPEPASEHVPALASAPEHAPAPAPAEVRAATSLEDLLPALVRTVAWNADGRRGVVHLELGAGSLSGTRLVIEADAGRVRVTIAAPASVHASVDLSGWRERIAARLVARGLDVGSVDVE
jgi:hypothetical protein